MRLHQLEVFLAVVDAGSIRGAARALHVSSPAVTKTVRQLEQQLRVRLVERTQHGVVVTPAGRAFLARARAVRSELRKAEEELAHFSGAGGGSVAFGVGPTAIIFLADAMTRFSRQYPDAHVRIVEGRHPALIPLVRDGTLDFALGLATEGKLDSGLAFRPLFRQHFAVAARKRHPLRNARSLRELAQGRWLTVGGGAVDRAFVSVGIQLPTPMIVCEASLNTLFAFLAQTDILTMTPRLLLETPFGRQYLEEIPVADRIPSIPHGLYTRADTPLTPVAAAMAKAVIAVARNLARRD